MKLTLHARPPFSLSSVVSSHGWVDLAPFSSRSERTDSLGRVERLGSGRVVALLICEAGDGVSIKVDRPLGDGECAEVARRVRWMLGLDQDLSAFYAAVQDEPQLAHVEEEARGRILRSPTFFEDVVKTLLTTNTSWGGTVRMVEALVARFGDPLPAEPDRCAFPTPKQLASSDEARLRSVGLGYRAPYVLTLARSVASGELDLEALKMARLSTPELRERLLSVKGVGDYAAAHLLMLLGRYDFVPVDSWARKMVSQEWHGGEPVGRAEVEAAFERWGRWKGLAYWFWDWSEASS